GVRTHVLFGVRFEDSSEAEPEGSQAPADHRRTPPLASVEIGESTKQVGVESGAVIVGKQSVPRPGTHRFTAHGTHRLDDAVERFIPSGAAPAVGPSCPHQRVQQALRIVEDLQRGPAPDAQKPLAIGVALVAGDFVYSPVLHMDEHAAERWVAVHRTHRPHGVARAHGAKEYNSENRRGSLDGVGPGVSNLLDKSSPRHTLSCWNSAKLEEAIVWQSFVGSRNRSVGSPVRALGTHWT